jgi:hypothetical protein
MLSFEVINVTPSHHHNSGQEGGFIPLLGFEANLVELSANITIVAGAPAAITKTDLSHAQF